jgi:hypothetical protein
VVSPVLLLGTERWGGGGGGVGKMVGHSPEQHGWRWWGDRDGCLDPSATGPYGGGSRPRREEKTTRKEKLRIGSAIGPSMVEEHRRARARVQP